MPTERRRQVTDVRALRALANPVRYRIFGHLMAFGSQTASECAAVVGATPSNCSYHLRELARFGLVERVDDGAGDGDGRERPWRPTATGFSYQVAEDGSRRPVGTTARTSPFSTPASTTTPPSPTRPPSARDPVPGVAAGRVVRHLRPPGHARRAGRPGHGHRRPAPAVHRPHPRRRRRRRRAGPRRVPRVPAAGDRMSAATGTGDPTAGPSPLRNPCLRPPVARRPGQRPRRLDAAHRPAGVRVPAHGLRPHDRDRVRGRDDPGPARRPGGAASSWTGSTAVGSSSPARSSRRSSCCRSSRSPRPTACGSSTSSRPASPCSRGSAARRRWPSCRAWSCPASSPRRTRSSAVSQNIARLVGLAARRPRGRAGSASPASWSSTRSRSWLSRCSSRASASPAAARPRRRAASDPPERPRAERPQPRWPSGSMGCGRSSASPASQHAIVIGAASQVAQGMFVVLFVVFVLDGWPRDGGGGRPHPRRPGDRRRHRRRGDRDPGGHGSGRGRWSAGASSPSASSAS